MCLLAHSEVAWQVFLGSTLRQDCRYIVSPVCGRNTQQLRGFIHNVAHLLARPS